MFKIQTHIKLIHGPYFILIGQMTGPFHMAKLSKYNTCCSVYKNEWFSHGWSEESLTQSKSSTCKPLFGGGKKQKPHERPGRQSSIRLQKQQRRDGARARNAQTQRGTSHHSTTRRDADEVQWDGSHSELLLSLPSPPTAAAAAAGAGDGAAPSLLGWGDWE